MSQAFVVGNGCNNLITTMAAKAITDAARADFKITVNKPFRIELSNLFPRTASNIATCMYEQTAVESASPAVPINQIRVRLRTILITTAIVAVMAGNFES
jgi:hypothetical protein